jgi:hypothetical protein
MTETKVPEGSFLIEEDADYHAIAKRAEAVSASALKVFRQSPRDYQAQYLRGEIKRSESPALVIGRAAHALILEGVETFEKSFVMVEDLDEEFGFVNPKTGSMYGETTKAWKEAKTKLDEVHPGTTIISRDVWSDCQGMAASVRQHPIACKMLEVGDAERVFRKKVNDEPFYRQSRIDFVADIGSGGIVLVDLKTTDDLSSFSRKAWKFGYPEQLAFYKDLFCRTTGNTPGEIDVLIVAVEKKAPYKVAVANLPHAVLQVLQNRNEENISRLAQLFNGEDDWPTGYEGVMPWFQEFEG